MEACPGRLRDWGSHPCLLPHKTYEGGEPEDGNRPRRRACGALASLGQDLICKVWSHARGRVLIGMATGKALRRALAHVPRVALALERIPNDMEAASDAVASMLRFQGEISLDLRLRDQLGPVLQPLYWLSCAAPFTTSLDLRGSDLNAEGAALLAGVVSTSGFTRLQSLQLECNDLREDGLGQLSQSLPNLPSLTELSLGRTEMQDSGLFHLAGCLPLCHSITSIHLHSNFLGPGGARCLSDVLPQCGPQMTSLNLSRNLIGSEGTKYLSSALPHCRLTSLDLSSNEIRGQGVYWIAQALKAGFSTLRRLDLDSNCIGRLRTESLALFCEGLINSKDLQVLSLRENGIHRESTIGERLIENLPDCSVEVDDGPPDRELHERGACW
mmetsp:Transcript_19355/g.47499  ORF Transcript_19355/g.47499 Transcript_19355/m.47499 type:complete len:386 (-) Transcript_19355:78-1235(-)